MMNNKIIMNNGAVNNKTSNVITPSIEMLFSEEQYEQLEIPPYNDMIPFVQREFQYSTHIIRFYIILNILLLLLIIVIAYLQIAAGIIYFWKVLNAVFLGFAITLTLLIPVHEAIHGVAYKLAGAPKVSFGGNWRKFYFYAVADRFVIGKKAFKMVALAPFIIISFIGIIILLFSSIFTQYIILGILLMHTGACAGDFGMLGFYARFSDSEIFTFDDVAAQKAYFFRKSAP